MGSHVLRTKNIHCALRIGAFPFSERIRRACIVLRVFLSRFTVRMRRVYRALFGSHALRTKNIHCVLCFGAFTILERETYILSSAFSLSYFGTPKSTVYVFRRYYYKGSHALRTKNIRRVLRFGAFTFSERRICIVCSMFVSPVIHGWYEFGRIAYHQYVIYAVHQCCDS